MIGVVAIVEYSIFGMQSFPLFPESFVPVDNTFHFLKNSLIFLQEGGVFLSQKIMVGFVYFIQLLLVTYFLFILATIRTS